MKRKIITFMLGLTLIAGLTACAGNKPAQADKTETETKQEQRKNVKETDETTGESYYLMGDFENYFEATQVKYGATFGTVTQVKKADEPDMVTYGEQSLKLKIVGTEQTWHQHNPYLRFSTNNGFFNLTTDFSNMSRFTFDIYNGQDYEVSIRFYPDVNVNPRSTLADRVLVNDNYAYRITNIITLEPNQWNHVEIPAKEMKIIQYDTEGRAYNVYGAEALQAIGGFHIMFDRGELHEKQQIYYLDNVRAYLENTES